MFRKRRANTQEQEKIQTLQGMGFSAYQAQQALTAADGNVEQAADILLTQPPSPVASSSNKPARVPIVLDDGLVSETEEQQLRRAMEASKLSEQERKSNVRERQQQSVSAAARKAGEAATQRASTASQRFGANGQLLKSKKKNTTSRKTSSATKSITTVSSSQKPSGNFTHPNVTVPTQMKDKSKEEQILRCTQRLAPHFHAVDTLLQALLRLRDQPSNAKVRTIQTTSAGYQKALHNKPGAKDFLQAMNFQERNQGRSLVLAEERVDAALLYLGISALEQVRMTEDYKVGKRRDRFEKDVVRIQNGEGVENPDQEVVKRANFISKCPSEPTGGAGALVQVTLGSETMRRRFDGDDMLQDVIHWMGGSGSVIPEKILEREWCLVDLNRYPIAPIDVAGNMERTLQFVGCWPSGRLEIRPSSEEWKNKITTMEKMGSSRGLGAAPSSTL